MKLYILTPEKQLASVADWSNAEDPTSANFVVIENNDGSRVMLYKKRLADGNKVNYDAAKKLASEFALDGFDGFTLGSVDQWCSAYEARFIDGDNLNDALNLIDGDSILNWNWTDRAFQSCAAYGAWIFTGGGNLSHDYGRFYSTYARVFRAF